MRSTLEHCIVTTRGLARAWGVVFEYELPLEDGRRPDVVVLAGDSIVVLEFQTGAHVAKWFNADASDPGSSCALARVATEFMCQGLELDLPIVCWGEDFLWHDGGWRYCPVKRRKPLRDPEEILRNVYRVLLTRGRDGLVVWLPPDRILDATELTLLAAGADSLPEALEIDVESAVG